MHYWFFRFRLAYSNSKGVLLQRCYVNIVFNGKWIMKKRKENRSSFSRQRKSILLGRNWTFRSVWMLKAIQAGVFSCCSHHGRWRNAWSDVFFLFSPLHLCKRMLLSWSTFSDSAAVMRADPHENKCKLCPVTGVLEERSLIRTHSLSLSLSLRAGKVLTIFSTSTSAQLALCWSAVVSRFPAPDCASVMKSACQWFVSECRL